MKKSPFKWLGSKADLCQKLSKHIPKEGNCFVELFSGGASFAINSDYDHYVLNDLNKDLIQAYSDIINQKDAFLTNLESLYSRFNDEKGYYECRSAFNELEPCIERSALFLFFNRHGFRGLVRYSKKSGFNSPYGNYKAPYFPEEEIHFFSDKFKNATLLNVDFKMAAQVIDNKSTVFSDPPYIPLTKTASFVNYTSTGFTRENHEELDFIARNHSLNGGEFFITNSSVPLVKELYRNAITTTRYKARRSISAKAKKHKMAFEVLLKY